MLLFSCVLLYPRSLFTRFRVSRLVQNAHLLVSAAQTSTEMSQTLQATKWTVRHSSRVLQTSVVSQSSASHLAGSKSSSVKYCLSFSCGHDKIGRFNQFITCTFIYNLPHIISGITQYSGSTTATHHVVEGIGS